MSVAGVLPASAVHVWLREPTGGDELRGARGPGSPALTMLALAGRLGADMAGRPIDWPALPAADLAAVAMLIRAAWLGGTIRAEALCPGDGLRRADRHRLHDLGLPRAPPFAAAAGGRASSSPAGTASGERTTRFRVPTIADLVEALGDTRPTASMHARCVRPPDPPAALARRIDRALDALAPRLDGALRGECPTCGRTIDLRFEPISYVLEELRDASTGLFGEIHELALAYHWSEHAILRLGRRRRRSYTAMIRGELVLA